MRYTFCMKKTTYYLLALPLFIALGLEASKPLKKNFKRKDPSTTKKVSSHSKEEISSSESDMASDEEIKKHKKISDVTFYIRAERSKLKMVVLSEKETIEDLYKEVYNRIGIEEKIKNKNECTACYARKAVLPLLKVNGKRIDRRENATIDIYTYFIKKGIFDRYRITLNLDFPMIGGGAHIFNLRAGKIDENLYYKNAKIAINTYHISCKSYRPKKLYGKEDLGGVVLYMYGHKADWRLNGVHCKAGYIILKRSKDVKHLKGAGMIHGSVYKSVFKEDLCTKHVVGSGFAYHNKQWKFNSYTFNAVSDAFHDKKKGMNPVEKKWVMKAIENWIARREQNTKVTDDLALFARKF